jgi:hypothetical protein
MKKTILFFCLIFIVQLKLIGQELNCSVIIISDQVQISDKTVFENLKQTIYEFMNNTQWTNDDYDIHEKIECNLQLNITEVVNKTNYKATLQITSTRPIYNSDYNSTILNTLDKSISFSYSQNSRLVFTDGQYKNELSSILAFYAYTIIGLDYDSYGLLGGTKYLVKAQDISSVAQSSGGSGWKASDGSNSRYFLVYEYMNPQFEPFRKLMYTYHRNGLDIMYSKLDEGKQNVMESLESIQEIYKFNPSSYFTRVFFQAKYQELISMYSNTSLDSRKTISSMLSKYDPTHIKDYDKLNKVK